MDRSTQKKRARRAVKAIPNREAPAKGDLKQKERPVAVNGEENTKEGQENENTNEYTVELDDLKMVFKRIYPAQSDSKENERPAKRLHANIPYAKANNEVKVIPNREVPAKSDLKQKEKPLAVNREEKTKEGQENENLYEYTVELNDLKMVFKRIYPAGSDSEKKERPAPKLHTIFSSAKAKNMRQLMKKKFGPNKQCLPDRKKVESISEADEREKLAIMRAKMELQNRCSKGNAKRKSKYGI